MAKIMVVDDAGVIRFMLKKLFEKNGFEVIALDNGKKAISQYSEIKPDLVTMDITMPEMDGITAVQEIMKIDPLAKIVVCSALGQADKVKAAMLAGAKSFLVKPFQPEKVLAAVQKVLSE